jgi:hypothetical protein
MSANGVFTSSLDYTFFAGGFSIVTGGVPAQTIDYTLNSDVFVPITGDMQTLPLDFVFSAAITPPIIQASADLSFGFTGNSFLEFGIQSFLSSEWINRIEFSANGFAETVVAGVGDITLPFILDTNIFVFSLGDGLTGFDFSVEGKGTNLSTHLFSTTGDNSLKFIDNDFNGYLIPKESNAVKIISDGATDVEILLY